MTAVTAITAQSTVGVEAVQAVSPRVIVAQVRAVAEDIGVDAVKVGMLGTVETVGAVVEALQHVGEAPVVIDPVMIAESGASCSTAKPPYVTGHGSTNSRRGGVLCRAVGAISPTGSVFPAGSLFQRKRNLR